MLKMVTNIKVPQVMHRFTMGTFLSEAYSEHLHNSWTSLHIIFMPMYH